MTTYGPFYNMDSWATTCMPYTPFYNPGFGGFSGIGSSSSSDSTTTSACGMKISESLEEFKARLRKENAENISNLMQQVAENKVAYEEAKEKKDDIIKHIKEDGSAETPEKLSKMTTWEKIGTVVKGVANGIFDAAAGAIKAIAGFDKEGHWSFKQCLIGVGTTVATILACTPAAAVAVPALAYLAPALMATGVAAGAATAVVGGVKIAKAFKHDNAEELKAGCGQVATGALTAFTAGKGLKNSGLLNLKGAFSGFKIKTPFKSLGSGFKTVGQNLKNFKPYQLAKDARKCYCVDRPLFTKAFWKNSGKLKKLQLNKRKYKIARDFYKNEMNDPKITKCENTFRKNFAEGSKNYTDNLMQAELQNLDSATNIENVSNVGKNITTGLKNLKGNTWYKRLWPFGKDRAKIRALKKMKKALDALKKEKIDLMKQMAKSPKHNYYANRFFLKPDKGFGHWVPGFIYRGWKSFGSSWQGMSRWQKTKRIGGIALIAMGPEYTFAKYANTPECTAIANHTYLTQPTKHGTGDLLEMFGSKPESIRYTAEEVQAKLTEFDTVIKEQEKAIAELKSYETLA